MKWVLGSSLALLLLFAALLVWRREAIPVPGLEPEPVASSPLAPSRPLPALPPPAPPKEEGVNPGLVKDIKAEALLFDQPKVDMLASQRRIEAMAAAMGPKEIQFARDKALDDKGSAAESIVSLYLLVTGRQYGALQDVALAPRKYRTGSDPHSLEATKGMQEKAKVNMAVEALLEAAKADPDARRRLEEIATATDDPALRSYILKKLQ